MKKIFGITLSLIMCLFAFVACTNDKPAEEVHVHGRVLTSVVISQEGQTFSGLFHCDDCDEDYFDTIRTSDINMPIINIVGSLDGISKENKVTANIQYSSSNLNFECVSTFKLQGASSIRRGYPKENYSIQLFNDAAKTSKKKVEFVDGWGRQSKYVLKANYVDPTQSRNIATANLYGEMVRSRELTDEISGLYNGGAIDGYPVLLYHNGYYKGLYTLNIPKDKWLFGMGDGEAEAALMGDGYSSTTQLRNHVAYDFESSKMDLEYCSNEDTDTTWVVDSFNNMIDFILNNDGDDFKAGISNYISLERTMDSIIFTLVMSGSDNYQNNVMYLTYDGVHWQTSVYDMDATWGMNCYGRFNVDWDGLEVNDHDWYGPNNIINCNLLFQRIYENYYTELVARYNQLRQSVFTEQNILCLF